MKVGIPQALLYYKYYPLWETFLTELGATPVLSEPTNRQILNKGVKNAPSEICLPVKVFFGHALDLKDKVDAVFIPRIVSVEGCSFTCPKFLGLPDMIRNLENAPRVITATFNLKKKKREFYKAVYEVGKNFSFNPLKIYRAFKRGLAALRTFESGQLEGKMPANLLGDIKSDGSNSKIVKRSMARGGQSAGLPIKLGVVGHPYNIYDSYVSLNLLERLRKQGVEVETLEMISPEEVSCQASKLPKEIFWTYEKEVVGAVLHWLKNKNVDGIIYLLSFACGPDSLIQVVVEDQARKNQSIPLMSLVIDEHSAEAGMLTRLEAFLDMIKRGKN